MKKSLLLGAALAVAASASAVSNDGCTYEPVNGITLESLWCYAPDMNKAEWDAMTEATGMAGAYNRSIAVHDGKIYTTVGSMVTEGEGEDAVSSYSWKLVVFDIYTGAVVEQLPLLVDGEELNVLLGCNNIGFDSYGNCWVCGFFGGSEKNMRIPVYQVDLNTGALIAMPAIEWPADEVAALARMDHMDITGDITAKEDAAYFIGNASGASFNAYRFVLPQDGEEWEPGMDGYVSWIAEDVAAWPADAAGWGDFPTAVFAKGCNDIVYLSGRYTYPTQYSCADGMSELLGSFEQADPACQPAKPGAPGAWEFVLGDKMYLGYGNGQGAEGGRFMISQMGGNADGGTFEGMTLMWDVPAGDKSFISVSTGGGQHPVKAFNLPKDANGKEAAVVVSFYPKGGIAAYMMAEEGYNAEGVEGINADNSNAPVEYFNLQGVRVANPENGLFIRRQGNNATKVVM